MYECDSVALRNQPCHYQRPHKAGAPDHQHSHPRPSLTNIPYTPNFRRHTAEHSS